MEVKVDEIGLLDRTHEGCTDIPKVPDPPLPRAGTRGQDLVHGLTHWDLAPSAGLRDLKPEHPAAQVDTIPRETEKLTRTEPGLEGDGNDVSKQQIPTCAARREKTRLFVRLEPAEATLSLLLQLDLRDRWQRLPLLVGKLKQRAEGRQRPIDGRRGVMPSGERAPGGETPSLPGADLSCSNL